MATRAGILGTHGVGRAYAQAYADGDFDAVEALLAPDVHYRELTPRQTIDGHGPDLIVEEGRGFLAAYDDHETLELATGEIGRRSWARTRWRLRRDDETFVVEWCQYMSVEEGRITALHAVCSGPMPEQ